MVMAPPYSAGLDSLLVNKTFYYNFDNPHVRDTLIQDNATTHARGIFMGRERGVAAEDTHVVQARIKTRHQAHHHVQLEMEVDRSSPMDYSINSN